MNKKGIIVGILSLSTLVFVGCNSKESKENETKYESESIVDDASDDISEYEEETTNKVSSRDIDDLLDSYESYMNDYMDYMKKVKNSDMSALGDLPALMEKAEELGEKMDRVKSDMTPNQLARMLKLVNKVNSMMAEMY